MIPVLEKESKLCPTTDNLYFQVSLCSCGPRPKIAKSNKHQWSALLENAQEVSPGGKPDELSTV